MISTRLMTLFECGYAKNLVFGTVRFFCLFLSCGWVGVCKCEEKQCFLRPPKEKFKNDWKSWTFLLIHVCQCLVKIMSLKQIYILNCHKESIWVPLGG